MCSGELGYECIGLRCIFDSGGAVVSLVRNESEDRSKQYRNLCKLCSDEKLGKSKRPLTNTDLVRM